jgi:hypothetical protein
MGFFNPTTIVLVIALAALFISMLFSSLSASAAQKNDYASSRHYATLSAVILGVSILLCVAGIMTYVYRLPASQKLEVFSQSFKGWN